MLTEWYKYRAHEIEQCSGQVREKHELDCMSKRVNGWLHLNAACHSQKFKKGISCSSDYSKCYKKKQH